MIRNRFLEGVRPHFLCSIGEEGGAGGAGAGGAAGAGAGSGSGTGIGKEGTGAGAGTGAGSGSGAGAGAGAGAGGAAGAAAGTLAGDPGAAATAAAAAAAAAAGPAKFPANWREELAAGDANVLKDLQKYTDPNALYKSLRSLQADVSSGKLKAVAQLPANATDEQKAEFRKANGLPEKAEAYVEKLALPDGVVIGDNDKPLINDFAKWAHDKGWPQSQFDEAVNWWHQAQGLAEQQILEADGDHKTAGMTALMQEWGPGDYKQNMNIVSTVLAGMPEEFRIELLASRTPSGQLVGNTIGFNKYLAEIGRQLNPAATLVSFNDANPGKTIENEIAQIDAIYQKAVQGDGDARRQYYGYDGKPGLDVRQRELIEAQQRMQQQRGARAA